jgi:hypothetical protein
MDSENDVVHVPLAALFQAECYDSCMDDSSRVPGGYRVWRGALALLLSQVSPVTCEGFRLFCEPEFLL